MSSPETTSISVSGGNLVIEDTDGTKDNHYVFTSDGTALTIVDSSGNGFDLGAVTGTGDGTDTVTINFGAGGWTGGIIINGAGGDDTVEIDYSGGTDFAGRAITFNGQGQNSTPGDNLILTGGTFATAEYNYTTLNDGTIQFAGQGLITYTGLEPITSTITATDVTLNYNSATAETITVTDNAGTITVNSTNGEVTTFNEPSGSITIHASADDTVNFGNDLVFGGDLEVNAGNIGLNANVTTGGDLTLNGDTVVGATVTVNAVDAFFTGAVDLGANDLNLLVTGANSVASGEISGDGKLIKEGVGTFALNNATGNSYTGGTDVDGGTLLANNTSGSRRGQVRLCDDVDATRAGYRWGSSRRSAGLLQRLDRSQRGREHGDRGSAV